MMNLKPRARLSETQAIAIFQAKNSASIAARLATVYGVSEKAVRDIWTGRTWSRETWHLDQSRPLQLKLTGRPKGCRDTKPRAKRVDGRKKLSTLTAQVPCRHQADRHSVAGLPFEQDAQHMPLKQHEKWRAGLGSNHDSAVCFDDSSAGHRCRAAWPQSSTLCHASVDEQLHDWDEFWSASRSADPFYGDWKPHWSTELGP